MHKQLLVVSCCWSVTALDGHALCVCVGNRGDGSPWCTQSTTSPILHSSSSFSHSVILSRGLRSLIMFQCLIISNRGGNRFPIVASQFEQPAFPALLYVMSRVALTKRFVAWHLSRLIIPFAEAGSSVDFHGFLSVRIWSHVVKLHSPAIAWMAESYLTGIRSTKDLRAGCKTQKHMTSCSNLQPTHLLLHVRLLF